MTPYLKNGETYNPKLHYDKEWIYLVFNKFAIEWKQGANALAEDNLEAWIVSHVWTFVIDMALKDIEETRIGKSDGSSSASKIRKENQRICHSKIDLLLKLRNSSKEILAGEVARTGDIHDKKSLYTFGIQLFKNKGIIYMMDRPGEVVSRLTKKINLEASIYIENLCNLILSIITVLELKNTFREILKTIEKIESDELETQVFRKNIIGVRLPFAETTPTPRLSLETNK
ncbi:1221_t:CDS:2 [Funneliformis geosporum]|uniref:1221_t:CDS:1 n=1 Tax=Funneliformis geosporum TaxID=1117311 RepID=A0A9W4SQY2_9GLOM|nr:1221_t:CDS:2 [Funneliformis geosporum]